MEGQAWPLLNLKGTCHNYGTSSIFVLHCLLSSALWTWTLSLGLASIVHIRMAWPDWWASKPVSLPHRSFVMRACQRLSRGFLRVVSLMPWELGKGDVVFQKAAHPELPTGQQMCQSLRPGKMKSQPSIGWHKIYSCSVLAISRVGGKRRMRSPAFPPKHALIGEWPCVTVDRR